MEYIVNDIDNVIHLSNMGVLEAIFSNITSMSITNIRMDEFSLLAKKKIQTLFSKGVREIEIDTDFYQFEFNNRQLLKALGDGDKSSLYCAMKNKSTVITCNDLIYDIATKLSIKVIQTDDFLNSFIEDSAVINMFNEIKIA